MSPDDIAFVSGVASRLCKLDVFRQADIEVLADLTANLMLRVRKLEGEKLPPDALETILAAIQQRMVERREKMLLDQDRRAGGDVAAWLDQDRPILPPGS